MENTTLHHHAISQRPEAEKQQLINRCKRIEGQVRGIQKMIEEDRYCVDILVQLSAIQAALKQVGFTLLETHTKTCVTVAIQDGNGAQHMNELLTVVKQFSK